MRRRDMIALAAAGAAVPLFGAAANAPPPGYRVTWFNARTAEFLTTLKNTQDVFGNSLLDNTIVPFVTDIATADHSRSPLPSLIFGGRSLGMQGGQYLSFEAAPRKHNDVWLSIAQAYLPNADIMSAFADEAFAQYGSGPIPGLWSKPV